MRLALRYVGLRARALAGLIGAMARLHLALARVVLRLPRLNARLLLKLSLNQILFSGIQAAPLAASVATLIGGVCIIQSFALLSGLADDWIGTVLVSIIVRELGPLVSAITLIGRSGTAMATEIGSMRLNGEIDALRAYRVDPVAFIVLPRVVGACAGMFLLTVLFDACGILGGYGVSLLRADIPLALLAGRVTAALNNTDLALLVVKSIAFGETVAALCCHFGLRVRHSPTELPQAVTKAVVASLLAVFLMDGLIAALAYL